MGIKDLIKNLDRKERAWIIIAALFVIVITSIPHLCGLLNAPNGFSYFGRQALNSHDAPVYFSYLEQAREGDLLFRNLFTTGPQIKTLNIFWLSAGLLGRIFSLPPAWNFQIVRILLIPILILILYLLISFFFKDKKKRKICFVVLLFSSGLGALASSWLTPLFQSSYGYTNWPMDSWVPESNTFFTFYYSPHIIASLILMLLIFLLALLSFENNKKIYSVGAGILALLLFEFHPFHVPTIFGIIGV
jgi:hypothetical protein